MKKLAKKNKATSKKSSSKKPKNRTLIKVSRFLGFLLVLALAYTFLNYRDGLKNNYNDVYISDSLKITPWEKTKLDRAYRNYKDRVLIECKKENLPPAYFLSLTTLECSGKKSPKKRFEKKVFNHLKGVRDRRFKTFGSIRHKQLKGLSDGAIKNLATSWGPFQLMGYQAFELGVYVSDIRGKESVKYGIKWCYNRYGKYLKKEKFADCFHIHNTGKPLPKLGPPFTHDPQYITKGLKYMAYFNFKLNQ